MKISLVTWDKDFGDLVFRDRSQAHGIVLLRMGKLAVSERITRLAAYLQLDEPGFDSFLAFVLQLRKEVGVPHTLPELGVDDRQADLVAEMAVVDPSAGGNPRPLDKAGTSAIFAAASHGRL